MTEPQQNKDETSKALIKKCTYCQEMRPLTDFQRRTGRRAGPYSRRGPCRSCRGLAPQERAATSAPYGEEANLSAAPVTQHSLGANTAVHSLEASLPMEAQRPRRKPVTDKARERHRQRVRHLLSRLKPADTRALRLNRNGMIRLRGKTDQGDAGIKRLSLIWP